MVTRLIDHTLYPRQAVSAARAAYKDYCTVRIEPTASNKATLIIEVLPAHSSDERAVILSFMNFALDKALELQLAKL